MHKVYPIITWALLKLTFIRRFDGEAISKGELPPHWISLISIKHVNFLGDIPETEWHQKMFRIKITVFSD